MLRVLTAGESHGPELIAIMEGLPAGVPVSPEDIQADLQRRKLGYGRGSRMKFEQDELTISSGIRHGYSMGSPIALRIGNTEWPKWTEVMSATPVELSEKSRGRGAPLTRPRPGHADLVGMQKYGFEESRPILERASARETAARVAPWGWHVQVYANLPLLAACGTPQERCISRNTSEYRTVSALLAEVEGNLARGYAWEERQVIRSRFDQCQRVFRDKDGNTQVHSYGCWRDYADTERYRVPIDPAAEARKRDGLAARQASLGRSANAAVQACRAAYPEES